jgi:hypothetical protein
MTPAILRQVKCSFYARGIGGFALVLAVSLFGSSGRLPGYRSDLISGVWSDACPCLVPCGCWRTQRSAAVKCVNLHVFKVQRGTYEDVDLTGSVFVLLNLPTEAHAAPKANTLFVESSASPRQREAIEALVSNYFGPVPSKSVVIKFSQDGHGQKAVIPGLLNYKIKFREMSPADEVKDYLYTWLYDAKQGTTLEVTYTPPGQKEVRYSAPKTSPFVPNAKGEGILDLT